MLCVSYVSFVMPIREMFKKCYNASYWDLYYDFPIRDCNGIVSLWFVYDHIPLVIQTSQTKPIWSSSFHCFFCVVDPQSCSSSRTDPQDPINKAVHNKVRTQQFNILLLKFHFKQVMITVYVCMLCKLLFILKKFTMDKWPVCIVVWCVGVCLFCPHAVVYMSDMWTSSINGWKCCLI